MRGKSRGRDGHIQNTLYEVPKELLKILFKRSKERSASSASLLLIFSPLAVCASLLRSSTRMTGRSSGQVSRVTVPSSRRSMSCCN